MKHIHFIILLFVVLILLKKQLKDFEVNDIRYNVVNIADYLYLIH